MRRAKRMLAAAFASALLMGAVSSPVFAVNDKFVPAEDCAPPNSEAVGHPAAAKEQSPKASAPFSDENPGESSGAKAVDKEQASC